jgi:hypothetical protein
MTSERQSALLAVCPSAVSARAVAARKVSPPSVLPSWLESASAQAPIAGVVPAAPAVRVAVPVTPVAVAVPVSVLVPAARVAVAAPATESARVDLAVLTAEPTTNGNARNDDQFHVASAAQLDQREIRVQGTSGLSAKHGMTAPKPNGGVRGAPPRGRPV